MFFPSLYSGISGLARSVNHVCRLASFKVARAGNLNVEGLGTPGNKEGNQRGDWFIGWLLTVQEVYFRYDERRSERIYSQVPTRHHL